MTGSITGPGGVQSIPGVRRALGQRRPPCRCRAHGDRHSRHVFLRADRARV